MEQFEQIIRRTSERIYEDEQLRSNLNDDEAQVVLNWAEQWTSAQVAAAADENRARQIAQNELTRVRQAVKTMNTLAAKPGALRLSDAIAAFEPQVQAAEAMPRARVFKLLTEFVGALWKMQAEKTTALPDHPQTNPASATKSNPCNGEYSMSPNRSSHSKNVSSVGGAGFPGGLIVIGLVALIALCLVTAVLFAILFLMPPESPTPVAQPPSSSSSSGATWYQVYFTTPKYPDKEADHHGGLDEKLTAFINRAQTSVDIAIYQLDLPNVTQALLDVKKRGAVVRVVTDIDILDDPKENPSFKEMQKAGITVVGGNSNAIMHDKFVVVDVRAVWTGSWNFTVNDTFRYNNNAAEIQSPELAKNYTAAFEKMFNDKKFGPSRKPGGTTPRLTIGGIAVENYFAPEDKPTDKIVARLKAATKSIDFMAFSFTDDSMGDAILARAQAGVNVRGVFENTGSETKFSEYGRLNDARLDVWQDGNPYLMHHKVFIIDGKTVIFGSFNFSAAANEDNDENLLIVDDLGLAQAFTTEFQRVYDQAKNPPKK